LTDTTKILISKCKNNNRRAQYELFDLYLPYVNIVVRRYLFDQSNIKDIVQEVFITVFKSIKTSYDPQKGDFKPWLRTITINRCIKQNKNYKSFDDLDETEHDLSIEPAVFTAFDKEELLQYLLQMPEKYRLVFNMAIIDDYSHKEIATTLGITEASSRKKLSRAREWLSQRIQTSKSYFNLS
jgi:RNA polymerase sigma-70 factor (ECF subfamily)